MQCINDLPRDSSSQLWRLLREEVWLHCILQEDIKVLTAIREWSKGNTRDRGSMQCNKSVWRGWNCVTRLKQRTTTGENSE